MAARSKITLEFDILELGRSILVLSRLLNGLLTKLVVDPIELLERASLIGGL